MCGGARGCAVRGRAGAGGAVARSGDAVPLAARQRHPRRGAARHRSANARVPPQCQRAEGTGAHPTTRNLETTKIRDTKNL